MRTIQQLEGEYYRRLCDRADKWIARHPEEVAVMTKAIRVRMMLAEGEDLPSQRRSIREFLLEDIRVKLELPSSDEWVAKQRLADMDKTAPSVPV